MKKKSSTMFIFVLLILTLILNSDVVVAQQTDRVRETPISKGAAPNKKKVATRPGDIDPGNAAVAGYEETNVFGQKVRSYRIKDKSNRTYIFSEVEGHLPGQAYGYFRVLDYYGYGREEEYKRDHLIFASKTPMPACKDPVKVECGGPLREAGGYIALFMYGSNFAIYNPVLNYGSGALSYLDADVPEQEIIDIDGDGNLEIKAFEWLKDTPKRLSVPLTQILGIYKYVPYDKNCGCSKFVKVKGHAYEKAYMEYANRVKKEKKIIAWLASVECTENPVLISAALNEFINLPSPDQKQKEVILEMLINNGFVGLKSQ